MLLKRMHFRLLEKAPDSIGLAGQSFHIPLNPTALENPPQPVRHDYEADALPRTTRSIPLPSRTLDIQLAMTTEADARKLSLGPLPALHLCPGPSREAKVGSDDVSIVNFVEVELVQKKHIQALRQAGFRKTDPRAL